MKLAAVSAIALFALAAAATGQAAAAPNPLDVVPDGMSFGTPYGTPISLDRANAVLAAGVAECKKRGWPMNFAVVDAGGNLVAFQRMDNAQYGSIAVSQHKAKAAVDFRRETKVWENNIQGGNVYQLTLDGVIASRGGIPLIEGGKIVGAIGASGAAGAQDEVCAKAAAAVINR